MKTLYYRELQKLYLIATCFLMVIAFSGCVTTGAGSDKTAGGVWVPYTNGLAGNKAFACGQEEELFVNPERHELRVKYEIKNECEFSAYWWVETADNIMVPGTCRRLPAGQTHQGPVELPPRYKIVVHCTLVDQTSAGGCTGSYKVLAFR